MASIPGLATSMATDTFDLTRAAMAIASVPDVIVLTDGELSVTYFSPSGTTMLGYQPDEMVGKNVAEFVHPVDLQRARREVSSAAAQGESDFRFLARTCHRGGMWLWLEYSLHAIREDQGGAFTGFSITARDATDRLSEERHLRETRDRLDGVLRAATEYSIIGTDVNGTIEVFNPGAELLLGYRAEEMIGRNIQMFFTGDSITEESAVATEWSESERELATKGYTRDWTYRRKDGTRVPVSMTAGPMHNQDGELIGFIGISRDVSEERRAKQETEAAERMFRGAFDEAPHGVAMVGLDGRWMRVNPALVQIFGYIEETLLATNFQELTHPDDLEADLVLMNQLLDGEIKTYQMEKRYRHADGHWIYALLGVALVRDAAGRPLNFISHIIDISDRKHAEQRLDELAHSDALTALPNRLYFMNRLREMGERHARGHQRAAVLFIDLNKFKPINDEFGHAIGDMVLCEVAERIRQNARPGDVIARIGGDEFTVLLESADQIQTSLVAERISNALQLPYNVADHQIEMSASVGIGMVRPGEDPESVLHQADQAMYRDKQR
ncbi:MAG: PAS domain S-box protein [Solirubrobacterales bacterium]